VDGARKRGVVFSFYCAAILAIAGCRGAAGPTALPNLGALNDQGRALGASARFAHLVSLDGANDSQPEAGLIDLNGVLYGTTQLGGSSGCFGGYSTPGCGTVFKVTASGKATAIHSFTGAPDGAIS
jgi:hypothetical protein